MWALSIKREYRRSFAKLDRQNNLPKVLSFAVVLVPNPRGDELGGTGGRGIHCEVPSTVSAMYSYACLNPVIWRCSSSPSRMKGSIDG